MKHENLLAHAIWLKSESNMTAFNAYTTDRLMSKLEFLEGRELPMITVEKIIYHAVMNDFSRSPYDNFDPCEFQNAYTENNDVIEEIKYLIFKTCGHDTKYFHKDVIAKHRDFDHQYVWKKEPTGRGGFMVCG